MKATAYFKGLRAEDPSFVRASLSYIKRARRAVLNFRLKLLTPTARTRERAYSSGSSGKALGK